MFICRCLVRVVWRERREEERVEISMSMVKFESYIPVKSSLNIL